MRVEEAAGTARIQKTAERIIGTVYALRQESEDVESDAEEQCFSRPVTSAEILDAFGQIRVQHERLVENERVPDVISEPFDVSGHPMVVKADALSCSERHNYGPDVSRACVRAMAPYAHETSAIRTLSECVNIVHRGTKKQDGGDEERVLR